MRYEKFLTPTDKIVGRCVAKFFGVFDARKAEMKKMKGLELRILSSFSKTV